MNLIPWRHKRENRNGNGGREAPLMRLRGEIESLFDRFFDEPWSSRFLETFAPTLAVGPRIDLAESENDVTVTAELPGVDPKDVEISVSGNMLSIRGQKREDHEEKKRNYHYIERSFGSFQRSIQLPSSVDADKVDAVFKNGILTVTLQKRPDAKPKRITVQTA